MTKNQDKKVIDHFIQTYVKNIREGSAAIFAGAGLSVGAGFVDWKELLSDVAEMLNLDINKEYDYTLLCQFYINEYQNRHHINSKILNEFAKQSKLTENHKIIAKLPISTIWTTNYDQLLERAFRDSGKVVDVKHNVQQLTNSIPGADVKIYKMHGDVDYPFDAILAKEQYEKYSTSHAAFIRELSAALSSKTFLFLGFSFNDPNVDHVLRLVRHSFGQNQRNHYWIEKRKTVSTSTSNSNLAQSDHLDHKDNLLHEHRRQELMINELKRYGIQTILIDEYDEITSILENISMQLKNKTVFISGSISDYQSDSKNSDDEEKILEFTHKLSYELIKNQYRVVNGFGLAVGSAVINGALAAIEDNPSTCSESQLILKPFPQLQTGTKSLEELWQEYRQMMIALTGISIFIAGNKYIDGKLPKGKSNDGIRSEYEISQNNSNICIPVPMKQKSRYSSDVLFDELLNNSGVESLDLIELLKALGNEEITHEQAISLIINYIKTIN